MAKGISTSGDVLVNVTADGVDLNEIWAEIADALALYNAERTAVARLLSYPTTVPADAVPQSISSESFEEATEFGEPRAIRPPSDVLKLGYSFKDWDISLRATWKFLRDATAEQVTAQVTRVLEADNKLVNGTILRRLFGPAPVLNDWQHTVYGLWCNDGMVPPPYLGKTFLGTHTHYLTSQSTVIDSQDIEDMIKHVKEHGYGSQMLIFAHPDDVDAATMTAWRAGVEYRTGGPLPKWDFIPSALMPAWISDETIHGPIPNADLMVSRSGVHTAGRCLSSPLTCLPGTLSWSRRVAQIQTQTRLVSGSTRTLLTQGLRHIPGTHVGYPLQDSFFARGFGVGVRHRGAAVVCQITASATYISPAIAI